MKTNPTIKKTCDTVVSAKVHGPDLEVLKSYNINVSKLLREAVEDAARRCQSKRRAR